MQIAALQVDESEEEKRTRGSCGDARVDTERLRTLIGVGTVDWPILD
jgi:hypothetical protein